MMNTCPGMLTAFETLRREAEEAKMNETKADTEGSLDGFFPSTAEAKEEAASLFGETETTAEKKARKKRKQVWRNPDEDEIVVVFQKVPPSTIDQIKEQLESEEVQDDYPGARLIRKKDRSVVRFYPSREERRKMSNEQRRLNSQSEAAQARRRDSKSLEKLKEYNKKPEVIERKCKRAAARSEILKRIKEADPEKYNQDIQVIIEEVLPLKKKRKLNNGTTASEKVDIKEASSQTDTGAESSPTQ